MIRIFLFYAISGFVSLGYQVAWFRIFTDWFGSTNLTFALVVCCFIGGLGLGALCSKPVVNWLGGQLKMQDRLRLYGVVEILVSVTAFVTLLMGFLPADLWGSFPYQEVDGVWLKSTSYELGQILVAILCVSVPCFFMGITFPLLCDAFLDSEKADQLPSALYAWNTLGACSGVLACQFLLLPLIGHSDAFVLMVAINGVLGLYFLFTGGGSTLTAAAGIKRQDVDNPAESVDKGAPSGGVGLLFTAAVLSGLVAGGLEGDMFKRISLIIANNPGATMPAISFWAILGIFLASATVRGFPKLGLRHIKAAYVLAIFCYWLAWLFGYPVINTIEQQMFLIRDTQTFDATPAVAMFPGSMGQLFLFVGFFVFPAFFLISLLLPWVCNHLQADRRHLGIAYGLNTLAFCMGMIEFTLLAPLVSIFYSLKLIFVLLILAATLLLLMHEDRPLERWKPNVALGLFLVVGVFVPSGFDRSYVNPAYPSARYPVSAMKSNGAVTSFVVDQGDAKYLFFGNQTMSGTSHTGQTYMRVMAHFPLLAQKNPQKALLICFGVGNTASAIAAHDSISKIDIVDLNRRVFETAPEFSDTNNNVIEDPRVRLINDDGRAYLSVVDERYDLVTSEPPPPMSAGVYRLYSREYYQDVLAHLTPTGMMSQWLPYYQMPPEAVARAVNSFIDVFPHTLLISGLAEELVLIGGSQPINLDAIRERFSDAPAVVDDLKRIVISEPADLFARIIQTDKELREIYGGEGFISDENNHLEQVFPGWGRIPMISYNPTRMLGELRQQYPEIANELTPIVSNLGRLIFRVPDFPLYDISPDPNIRYSDADWKRVKRLKHHGIELLGQKDRNGAIEAFLQALEIVPENGLLLSYLGQIAFENGQPARATRAYRKLVALEPDKAVIRTWLAAGYAGMGRNAEAISQYRIALSIDPDNTEALRGLKQLRGVQPDS